MRPAILATILLLSPASLALAQDTPAAAAAAPAGAAESDSGLNLSLFNERWRLSAEPSLWYVSPGGDIRFPAAAGVESDVVAAVDINMESPRLSPFLELNLSSARWGATFRATTMSANSRGFTTTVPLQLGDTLLAPGSSASTSLDYLQAEAEVRYALFPWGRDNPESRFHAGWETFDHRFEVVGGVRLLDYTLDVNQISGGVVSDVAEIDETFILPYAGIKGSVEIERQITIDMATNFGGLPLDTTSFTWDVLVGFQYHPWENLGVQIGYRQLLFRLNDEDTQMKWDGAQAGLYFGLVGRF